jgi:hypothetical protein
MVGVGGPGAGVDAQLGLQRVADCAGAGEADQALGEDRCLRLGGQADGQSPRCDVIDGTAPGVGGGDAVADQPLVQRQVRELALLSTRIGEYRVRSRVPGPGHWVVAAVGLSRGGAGGCCRERWGDGTGL